MNQPGGPDHHPYASYCGCDECTARRRRRAEGEQYFARHFRSDIVRLAAAGAALGLIIWLPALLNEPLLDRAARVFGDIAGDRAPGVLEERETVRPRETVAAGSTSPGSAQQHAPHSDAELQLHERINDYREEQGLIRLEFRDDLAEVARDYSRDMSERGFFDHVNPEGMGPQDRVEAAGLTDYSCGENLIQTLNAPRPTDDRIVDDSFEGWRNSPGHYRNMVEPGYDTGGIGIHIVSRFGRYDIHVTHLLCRDTSQLNLLIAEIQRLNAEYDRLEAEYESLRDLYDAGQATYTELSQTYDRLNEASRHLNRLIRQYNTLLRSQ